MAKLSRIGQYKLVRKLGQGGMGAVFEGIQESLDRRVAIKILPAQFMRDPTFVERFKREAKAAARLNHPNIVTIHEIGEDQGFHFFSMELVDGLSLQQRLQQQGPFAIPEAIGLMLQAIRGLGHAWEQQIVHRDIKPDNLMLTKAGVLKITDLGLARVREEMGTMTQTGAGMGTPYYMSPEQGYNAKEADLRSDMYSLGATFYHLLTGRVPFEGSSPIEVAIKVATAPFPPLREVRPDTPSPVAAVIEKMLARKPEERFQNAAELLGALESLIAPSDESASDTKIESQRNTPLFSLDDIPAGIRELKKPCPIPLTDNEQLILSAHAASFHQMLGHVFGNFVLLATPGICLQLFSESAILHWIGYGLLIWSALLLLDRCLTGRSRVIVTTSRVILERAFRVEEMAFDTIDAVHANQLHTHNGVLRGHLRLHKTDGKRQVMLYLQHIDVVKRVIDAHLASRQQSSGNPAA